MIEGRPLKTRLNFINGSSIEALPNSPETIRGETSSLVIFDESSYIQDAEELYDASVYSIATTRGRFIATSTPGSLDSLFYRFCTDDAQYGDFSRHHVSYVDALEPKGPLKLDTLEKLRRQCAEDPWRWRREMEAEFAEDEEAWLSMSLITSCVDPDLEYLSEEEIDALPNIG
ncbi:MAG TPA: terminase family protein [Candidatus Bathyarchaeia archaeon]|nr:terminase family protein [Candidatus Bathyarchaeia archaeon]